ncbi:MAG: chromate transporter [Candidatus Limivicinus sp.]
MKKTKALLTLLLDFMRFGCFTFGGGWSIIAQMQQLYVQKKKVITAAELLDLTSVARSLPGTMIANVAMLYGYRMAGIPGGLICVFGMIVPPLVILILISFCYSAFRTNYWVMAVMEGMQAAVVPIIASAAIGLVKGSVKYPPCILVMLLCLGLYLFFDVSTICLVLIGVASGLLIGGYYEKKEARGHGPA